jgi:hypothetical protein
MIRLVTVIGHGHNLIPHFVQHYKQYVDEINIIVYESQISPDLKSKVEEQIKDYDNVFIVRTIKDRIFDWEKVTQLYNFIKSKHPNDWWVIADIDEFHLYPNNDLIGIIDDCNDKGYEIVRGGFIDRIGPDGEFVELKENQLIFEQYPNAGFFRYPLSQANPNKICIVKGYIEITAGQHYAKIEGQTTWRWQGWSHPLINPNFHVQVHHFKWDSTSIERIKSVADNNQGYSFSDEYRIMYNSLRKNRFKINLDNFLFMFEKNCILGDYKEYTNWNKLINKIKSI